MRVAAGGGYSVIQQGYWRGNRGRRNRRRMEEAVRIGQRAGVNTLHADNNNVEKHRVLFAAHGLCHFPV